MARSSKKRSKISKPRSIELPAPQLQDRNEFPSLSDAIPGKKKNGQPSSTSTVSDRDMIAEDGVCVDGTTYYMQAGTALCGISDTISPIGLNTSYTQKETSFRQFPGKAYSLHQENLEYPTLFLPRNIRQAVYDHLDEYRSYLFLPDQPNWIVCDHFQIYGSMEKESGLIQGRKNLVYMSRHRENGDFIVLRRLMNFVLRNQRAVDICSKWQTVNHPNLVRIHSITTTRVFNDPSVLFAYDFYPNTVTLEGFVSYESRLLDEETIWSFTTQLVSGLHAIHSAGLAARILGVKRILITGLDCCTIKINCAALADVIEIADVPHSTFTKCYLGEHRATREDQAADFRALGEVVQFMIDASTGDISEDLAGFGKALTDGTIQSVGMAVATLGTRVLDYITLYQKQKAILEVELCKEVENGRLLRLLYGLFEKIEKCDENFPGTEGSQMLSMFKDYLLSRGNMYEVISCLNKLDAGVREKIRLESYTDMTVKYVSYEELRRVLEDDKLMITTFFYHLNVFNDSGLIG